jgi:hypothetical protein
MAVWGRKEERAAGLQDAEPGRAAACSRGEGETATTNVL